jgi:hypothetical protein
MNKQTMNKTLLAPYKGWPDGAKPKTHETHETNKL